MNSLRPVTSEVKLLNNSKDVEIELAKQLPAYMIPTLFLDMPELPLTLTGKTNRKLLREIGTASLVERVAPQTTAQTHKQSPGTDAAQELQRLWARVLSVDSHSIGMDDNFFRLGGDSIVAMKLVGEARKIGIKLTVADIFHQPVLRELSSHKRVNQEQLREETLTTSVLDPSLKAASLFVTESANVGLRVEGVADILPLTNIQESFIIEGSNENRQFVDYYHLDLGLNVDLAKLKESCRQLLAAFPILRASFLPIDGRHWMVIPKHLEVPFSIFDKDLDLQVALNDFCLHDIATFERNQPIIAFVLLRNRTQGTRLLVRLSHAQYDGISISVIFEALIGAYRGRKIPELPSFAAYAAYIFRQRPRSIAYWQQLLKGSKPTDIGVNFLPKTITDSIAVPFRIEDQIASPKVPTGITTASLMSAAWAIFLCRIMEENEVVYGRLVNGRNSAIPGIEEVVGSCINVVPVRVDLSSYNSTTELVQSVQEQFILLGEADSLGFKDIVENCTDWPAGSTIYSCTQHQNIDEDLAFKIDGFIGRLRRFENPRRLPCFLYMISSLRGDQLGVQIFAHSHMITRETAQALLDSFCPVVEKLAAGLEVSSPLIEMLNSVEVQRLQLQIS